MHLPVRLNVNGFIKSMPRGALYFEFSDGIRLAYDKDLYESKYGVDDDSKVSPYKKYIAKLSSDNRVRRLVKMYYKAYDISEPNNINTPTQWVDMMAILQKGTVSNPYKYAFDYKQFFTIDVDNIKSCEYTGANYSIHQIGERDGIIDSDSLPISYIPIRDKNVVSINQIDMDNPSRVDQFHLKQDIRVDIDTEFDTLDNVLTWLGGVFVDHIDNSSDGSSIIIPKGKMFLNTKLVGYNGTEPLTPKPGMLACASYEPDPARADYRWDFDIRFFKWKDVKISNFESPVVSNYDEYRDHAYDFTIDYIKSIFFNAPIDENHLLLLNGVVVDRDDYDIKGDEIILKNVKLKVIELINEAYDEYGAIKTIGNIVENRLPSGGHFSLIRFSSVDGIKKIKLNRSKWCHKNHPYPFHVTFPEYNIGDLVLLDGMFEKYMLIDNKIIRYHLTDYIARYEDHNVMSDVNVERIWFTIE